MQTQGSRYPSSVYKNDKNLRKLLRESYFNECFNLGLAFCDIKVPINVKVSLDAVEMVNKFKMEKKLRKYDFVFYHIQNRSTYKTA